MGDRQLRDPQGEVPHMYLVELANSRPQSRSRSRPPKECQLYRADEKIAKMSVMLEESRGRGFSWRLEE